MDTAYNGLTSIAAAQAASDQMAKRSATRHGIARDTSYDAIGAENGAVYYGETACDVRPASLMDALRDRIAELSKHVDALHCEFDSRAILIGQAVSRIDGRGPVHAPTPPQEVGRPLDNIKLAVPQTGLAALDADIDALMGRITRLGALTSDFSAIARRVEAIA